MAEDPNNPPDTYDPLCQVNLKYRQGQGQNLHSQGGSSEAANPYANWYIGDLYEETLRRGLYAAVQEALTQILIASDNEARMRMHLSTMSNEDSGATRAMGKHPEYQQRPRSYMPAVQPMKRKETRPLAEEVIRDIIKELAEAKAPACRLHNITSTISRLEKVMVREGIKGQARAEALACCLKKMTTAYFPPEEARARKRIKKEADAEAGLSS